MLVFPDFFYRFPHKADGAANMNQNQNTATWNADVCFICHLFTSGAWSKAGDGGDSQHCSTATWPVEEMEESINWLQLSQQCINHVMCGASCYWACWKSAPCPYITCEASNKAADSGKSAQQCNSATWHAGFGCSPFPFVCKHLMRQLTVATLGSTPMLLLGTLHPKPAAST